MVKKPGLEPPILQPVAQRYATDLYGLLYTYSIHMIRPNVL
jgi:hypothetical protein